MTRDEIIAQLQPIFDELFMDPVVLTPELTANDVEEWTSLLQISISLAVEQHFGIRFRVGEVEATGSVGEFADLIARSVAGTRRVPGK
jgi:acyl carrier protein